jgi:Tol biopolymer transport system component
VRLDPGDRFGRYIVEGLIGEGGMGSVYRVLDTKLQRMVALKVVRTNAEDRGSNRQDPEGQTSPQARLLREARAAAGIDHVNAIAIHDVGEVGETTFIAMELVNGRSLRAAVGDASLAMPTRISWLLQVARALAAAHARGLVHRDVKPENVMVRNDGGVKVLDFGIATFGGGRYEGAPGLELSGGLTLNSWSTSASAAGRLLGTPLYMSPEQLRGEPFDARADQFAWGVVAYELLAGKPPWTAPVVTVSALGNLEDRKTPPLRSVAPTVPADVARVVHRALDPVPSSRYGSMDDVVCALELTERTDRKGAQSALLALAGAAVLAVGCGWLLLRRAAPIAGAMATRVRELPFQPVRPRRITFEDGCAEYPSFTRDGSAVVFDASRGSDSVLVVKSLADGSDRELTHTRGWDIGADVSPDGQRVAFNRSQAGASSTWVVDFKGGEPEQVSEGGVFPSFTPDGKAIWCGDRTRMRRVDLASRRETRIILSPNVNSSPRPRELRDGRVVVLYPGDRGQWTGLSVVAPDGNVRWLTADPSLPAPSTNAMWRPKLEDALAVTPDERFALFSHNTETGTVEMIAQPLDGSPAMRVDTADVNAPLGLAVSSDGRALAWSTCHSEQAPVRVGNDGKLSPLHEARRWLETGLAVVPGSRQLVLLSERDGVVAPWVTDLEGKTPPRKLMVEGTPLDVDVSPDGSEVALELGGIGIVLASIDGGASHALTRGFADARPRFRRDGLLLYFTRQLNGEAPRVFGVEARGGEARPVLEPGSSMATPSPVGDTLVFLQGTDESRLEVFVVDAPNAVPRRLSPELGPGPYRTLAFSRDGSKIALFRGSSQLVEIDAPSGKVLRTVDSGNDSFAGLAYLEDAPVVIRSQWRGDLWMADLVPPGPLVSGVR